MACHRLDPQLLTRAVQVALVGVGGTGSQVLTGLARLHTALLAVGHPAGLQVVAYDPDVVTGANIGRQLFFPSDVGASKACVLMHRVNISFGLNWSALSTVFTGAIALERQLARFDIIISCVDSAKARREVYHGMIHRTETTPKYWLDLGNAQNTGQVVLGETLSSMDLLVGTTTASAISQGKGKEEIKPFPRLPTVVDLYPDLLDPTIEEDDAPSCSLAESLEKQDLFVNDHISRWALHLLWTLFRKGAIEHHGYMINLADGIVNPIPVPEENV
jgi:PRTRC genetic system ThiF family protein